MPTWTNPGLTFQTGTLEPGRPLSATAYATYVRDNLTYLHDALQIASPTLSYGTATALVPGAVAQVGTGGTVVVRSDHVHGGQGAGRSWSSRPAPPSRQSPRSTSPVRA